jgi:hypothetical protein
MLQGQVFKLQTLSGSVHSAWSWSRVDLLDQVQLLDMSNHDIICAWNHIGKVVL